MRDLLVGLLGGGIASLLTAVGALYLLKAQREKLLAESDKIVAETECVEAGASEKITKTALQWLDHYEKELKVYRAERTGMSKRVAELEGQVKGLSAKVSHITKERDDLKARLEVFESELNKAKGRMSDLETENKDLRTGVRVLSQQIVEDLEAVPAWPHWCP